MQNFDAIWTVDMMFLSLVEIYVAYSRLSVSANDKKKQAGDKQGLVEKKEGSRKPVSIILKTSFRYTSSWYTL